MNTHVEFRSSQFPPYEHEQDQEMVNPGMWARRLVEYLAARLEPLGIATEPAIAEDFGWFVPVRNEAFPMAIVCAHCGEADDEFRCFVIPDRPVIRRFLRKIDTTADVGRLVAAIDRILSTDPEIRDVRWSEQ